MQKCDEEHETAARKPPRGSTTCGLVHVRPLNSSPSCWLTAAQNLAVGHETAFRPKLGTPPPLSILFGLLHLPRLKTSARLLVSTATQKIVLGAHETELRPPPPESIVLGGAHLVPCSRTARPRLSTAAQN